MRIHAGHTLRFILLVLCFGCPVASSSVESIGAGSAVAGGAIAEAHGWIVLPGPGDNGFVLVHLPPRHASIHGGVAGVARSARARVTVPTAIAADGRRLYMLFDGDPRKLLSIEASPTPIDGIWSDLPAGRMRPHSILPAGGTVLGMAVAGGRPMALLELDGQRRLLELAGNEWKEIELPESTDDNGGWAVFGDEDGPRLVRIGPASASLWRLDSGTGWLETEISLPPEASAVGMMRGRLALLAPEPDNPGHVLLLMASDAGVATVASIGLPASAGGVGLGAVVLPDTGGRLALLWAEKSEQGNGYVHKIREISLSTGQVLYDGPVERITPVSAAEFRLLAVGLVLVLVVSLFVVLRPVRERDAIVLLDGWALATPGRRFVATVLDFLLCSIPVSLVMGVPMGQILSAGVLFQSDDAWVAIPAVFAIGIVYGTVMESLFSATVGKLITGCRVTRVGSSDQDPPRPVAPGACFTRNLIKWVLPPVTGLAFLEPSGRHRGDLIARAVVVVHVDSPEEGSVE